MPNVIVKQYHANRELAQQVTNLNALVTKQIQLLINNGINTMLSAPCSGDELHDSIDLIIDQLQNIYQALTLLNSK